MIIELETTASADKSLESERRRKMDKHVLDGQRKKTEFVRRSPFLTVRSSWRATVLTESRLSQFHAQCGAPLHASCGTHSYLGRKSGIALGG